MEKNIPNTTQESTTPVHTHPLWKQLLLPLLVLLFLIVGTTSVVLYGKGYRLDFKRGEPQVARTGIMHVTSNPNGAQVFIDGHLTTATESTLNLTPGEYEITISKEGYFSWKKQIRIVQDQVTSVDASLFPIAPRLDSLTTFGAYNPVIDPSGTKIAFEIASQSATKNGIFILNMSSGNVQIPVLTSQNSVVQVADDTLVPFSTASLRWSPDSSQLLATLPSTDSQTTPTTYLLQTSGMNDSPQDITAILSTTVDSWKVQQQQQQQTRFVGMRTSLRKMINANFNILAWSPDETKILYEASTSATLPFIIKPRLPGINNLSETRSINKGSIYIYDAKEDTNFLILQSLPDACNVELPNCNIPLRWLADSSHLVYVNDRKVIVMDYDGSNHITVYAGPFSNNFAIPWSDGTKVVILTNLDNPDVPVTFYTIGLK